VIYICNGCTVEIFYCTVILIVVLWFFIFFLCVTELWASEDWIHWTCSYRYATVASRTAVWRDSMLPIRPASLLMLLKELIDLLLHHAGVTRQLHGRPCQTFSRRRALLFPRTTLCVYSKPFSTSKPITRCTQHDGLRFLSI